MTMFKSVLTAAAVIGLAAPAAAQYQGQVPQPAPGQPGYGYYPPQQGYPQQPGYGQPGYGYNQQNGLGQIINQLLGNRYQTNDRLAVERCATAAMVQANSRYGGNRYGQGYGNQGYYPGQMRVTAITDVRRRNNGVRVSGLLDSSGGGYGQPYGNAYGYQGQGYQNQGYAGQGDLTFRCTVAHNGAVTGLRVGRNQSAYNRGY